MNEIALSSSVTLNPINSKETLGENEKKMNNEVAGSSLQCGQHSSSKKSGKSSSLEGQTHQSSQQQSSFSSEGSIPNAVSIEAIHDLVDDRNTGNSTGMITNDQDNTTDRASVVLGMYIVLFNFRLS